MSQHDRPTWADGSRDRPSGSAPRRPVTATGGGGGLGRVPPVGAAIGGYVLASELGRGGMGVVFRATQLGAGREVALKLLPVGAGFGQAAQRAKRFRREGEALARLDHPNVVRVHDAGEADGFLYLAMELVEGEDLDAVLERGPLVPGRAATLARDLALALQAAHDQGVIHRDVKPGNVLLARDGTVRLTDFGLVRDHALELSRLTQSGVLLGTPAYMPPEQATGGSHDVGPTADVYSLGALLYELVTGELPFMADNPAILIRAVVERPPEPPSVLRPQVGPDLDAIVLKALAKAPADRYPTAQAMADDLDRFLDGRPVEARARAARRSRRPLIAAGVAVALVAAAGAGLGVADARSRAAAAERQRIQDAARTRLADAWAALVQRERPGREALVEALATVEEACADLPDDPAARTTRARLLRALQREDEARDELRAAQRLALAPGADLAAGDRAAYLLARLEHRAGRDSADVVAPLTAWTARRPPTRPSEPASPYRRLAALLEAVEGPEGMPLEEGARRAAALHRAQPDLAEAWELEWVFLSNAHRLTEAIPALDAYLRLAPYDAHAWRSRGAIRAFLLDDAAGGGSDLEQALAIDPNRVDALEARAVLCINAGDRAGGEANLLRALELAPDSARVLDYLVDLYAVQERTSDALRVIAQAEDDAPGSPHPYVIGARTLAGLNRFQDALGALRRGLARVAQPQQRAPLERALEDFVHDLRAPDDAEAVAQEVLAARPDDAFGLTLVGHAHALRGAAQDALAAWDRCLAAHPTYLPARLAQLRLQADRVEPDTFERMVERLLARWPASGEAFAFAAVATAERLGDPDRARDLADRAVALQPAAPAGARARARLALLRHDPAGAVELAELAIGLEPSAYESLLLHGEALAAAGRRRLALDRYAACAALRPVAVEPVERTVRTLLDLRRPDLARREVERLLAADRAVHGGPSLAAAILADEVTLALKGPTAVPDLLAKRPDGEAVGPDDAVRLARFFERAGQPARATEVLRRAAAEAPNHSGLQRALQALDDR